MPVTTCVFDAYGTLFDVNAAARIAAGEDGATAWAPRWPLLAESWRNKQLQYTWLRAVRGDHADFWSVTCDALDWAMEEAGLTDTALRERLLALYWELPAYPEVPAMLTALRQAGHRTAILSNGSPDMLRAAIASASLAGLLDATLSVESVQVYKPDDRVYGLVTTHFGCARDEVMFVSANGWDAASASRYGFRTVWVNRAGQPKERLAAPPAHVLKDLDPLPELLRSI